jgi:hypothetical protein
MFENRCKDGTAKKVKKYTVDYGEYGILKKTKIILTLDLVSFSPSANTAIMATSHLS